ncbi:MAG: glycerophosphodiester phosphodiesterase [Candidatus Dormibacteria bacterium]
MTSALARPHPQLIVAHRGARQHAPENTMRAFEEAYKCGADMIECDLRMLGDGTLVIMHDGFVGRKLLRTLTYEELKASCLPAAVPPTLEEVLQYCATTGMLLDLELKEGGYERNVLAVLDQYLPRSQVLITSFKDAVIATVTTLDPSWHTGLLLDMPRSRSPRQPSRSLLERRIACGAEYLVLQRSLYRLRPTFIRQLEVDKVPFLVWTVNHKRSLARLFGDRKVHGIITDRPDVARIIRDRLESRKALQGKELA